MDRLRRFLAQAVTWLGQHLVLWSRAVGHALWGTTWARVVFGVLAAILLLGTLVYNAPRQLALVAALAGPNGNDLGCLTLSIYRERATAERQGFDETKEGLIAIGWVMKTRYQLGFHQKGNPIPQDICDVVWEPRQFSWTLWSDTDKFTVADLQDFYRAYGAATDVLSETEVGLAVRYFLGPADHYFNKDIVLPTWAKGFQQELWIGKHLFLTDTGRYGARRKEIETQYGLRKQ